MIPVSSMPRLVDMLAPGEQSVRVKASFALDDDGRALVTLMVTAEVRLTCQRCAEPFGYPVVVESLVCPIHHERESAELPSHYAPFLFEGEQLSLAEMAEEELLLSLPLVPMHEDDCTRPENRAYYAAPTEAGVEKRNPFAELKNLL